MQQEKYHYTVRQIEGGRFECEIEELKQKVIADTPEDALKEAERLVAVRLYEVALGKAPAEAQAQA